jgi:plasmid maintenance system antidote protein VapI
MVAQVYETFTGEQVTNDMLVRAAELFNENYGVWANIKTSWKTGQVE